MNFESISSHLNSLVLCVWIFTKDQKWFYYSQTFKIIFLYNLPILSIPEEGYSRNASCALNLNICFYYYHWFDASAGGLLVPEGIIRPVVGVSVLKWFIRYIYY